MANLKCADNVYLKQARIPCPAHPNNGVPALVQCQPNDPAMCFKPLQIIGAYCWSNNTAYAYPIYVVEVGRDKQRMIVPQSLVEFYI